MSHWLPSSLGGLGYAVRCEVLLDIFRGVSVASTDSFLVYKLGLYPLDRLSTVAYFIVSG